MSCGWNVTRPASTASGKLAAKFCLDVSRYCTNTAVTDHTCLLAHFDYFRSVLKDELEVRVLLEQLKGEGALSAGDVDNRLLVELAPRVVGKRAGHRRIAIALHPK
jgi:hypothetical protein